MYFFYINRNTLPYIIEILGKNQAKKVQRFLYIFKVKIPFFQEGGELPLFIQFPKDDLKQNFSFHISFNQFPFMEIDKGNTFSLSFTPEEEGAKEVFFQFWKNPSLFNFQ